MWEKEFLDISRPEKPLTLRQEARQFDLMMKRHRDEQNRQEHEMQQRLMQREQLNRQMLEERKQVREQQRLEQQRLEQQRLERHKQTDQILKQQNQQIQQRKLQQQKQQTQTTRRTLYSQVDDLVEDLKQSRISDLNWKEEQLKQQADKLKQLEELEHKYGMQQIRQRLKNVAFEDRGYSQYDYEPSYSGFQYTRPASPYSHLPYSHSPRRFQSL